VSSHLNNARSSILRAKSNNSLIMHYCFFFQHLDESKSREGVKGFENIFRNLIDVVMFINSLFTITMIRISYVRVQLSASINQRCTCYHKSAGRSGVSVGKSIIKVCNAYLWSIVRQLLYEISVNLEHR
jgi:hypothetical protein